MTEHKATPEQWAQIEIANTVPLTVENWADLCSFSCLLDLRSRVKALEDAAKPVESNAPESSDSLVERVADAIHRNGTGDGWREEARAAIREVAAWLRQREARVRASVEIAGDLEREINQ